MDAFAIRSAAMIAVVLFSILASAPAVESQSDAALTRARLATRMMGVMDTLKIAQAAEPISQFQTSYPEIYSFLEKPYGRHDVGALSLDRLNAAYIALRAQARAVYDRHDLGFAGQDAFARSADIRGTATAAPLLPSQAALLVGVTDFVVERAKDEAAFGFLLTLRRNVRKDSAFVAAALPRSWGLARRIDTETFQMLMPTLRSAFVEDLNDLPRVVGTPEFKGAVGIRDSAHVVYLQGLAIAYSRGLDLRQGTPPAIALARLVEIGRTDLNERGTRHGLHLVGFLAREYAAAGGAPLVQELTQGDTRLRRYFLAIVANEAASLEPNSPLVPQFLELVSKHEPDAMALVNQLHSLGDALPGIANGNRDPESIATQVLTASGSALQVMNGAQQFIPVQSSTDPTFRKVVDDASRLHHALMDRDYGAIVTWLVHRPEIRLSETQLKYVSFAASLAAARNAEDVTTALRTASAPVGSFRSKRSQDGGVGPVRFSVTGYLGGAFGREETRGLSTEETDEYVGLALPLGLELSAGIPIGSLSLFVPVADLGAVASARLGSGQVDAEPEIGFQQVFTPGVFGVLGISRVFPLSIGFGVQYVPNLRRVSGGDETVNVFRKSVFVGVETTIFRF